MGTITELFDYFRLLYARLGKAYSYLSNEKMVHYSDAQIVSLIISEYLSQKIILLSPIVKARKGHYRELFDNLSRQGFSKVRVDGELLNLTRGMNCLLYTSDAADE